MTRIIALGLDLLLPFSEVNSLTMKTPVSRRYFEYRSEYRLGLPRGTWYGLTEKDHVELLGRHVAEEFPLSKTVLVCSTAPFCPHSRLVKR